MPSVDELTAARRRVRASNVILDPLEMTIAFDQAGVELDLGGIAKGYAVNRVVRLLKRRQIVAALVSAGGSTIYGLGAPPGRDAWDVAIQDPIDPRKTALTVQVKDRAPSVAGSSERSFQAESVMYSHIMDPRTGRPAQVERRGARGGEARLDDGSPPQLPLTCSAYQLIRVPS